MSAVQPIGCYVHHAGAGHAAHADALARVAPGRLVGLGSGPAPARLADRWVALPRDDDPPATGDLTRRGAWHWVPRDHPGYRSRMGRIASWVVDHRPAAFVVDVSVEVAALTTLLGVPTAAVLLHGERLDRPHRTLLDSVDLLLAPWPDAHREPWQEPWAAKLRPVGLLSRHDGRPVGPQADAPTVLVVLPAGGHVVLVEGIRAAAAATAADGWRWEVVGGERQGADGSICWHGSVPDPWPHLGRAHVVVGTAGAGTVADIAAARRPAVLLPQRRPFGEQDALAGHLRDRAPVEVLETWPDPAAWPGLLAQVAALDGAGWAALHDGQAAERAMAAVAEVAGGAW